MTLISKSRLTILTIPYLLMVCNISLVCAAMDPRFEIDPQVFADAAPTAKTPARKNIRPAKMSPAKVVTTVSENTYVIKPGDHLFKILIRDYGLSNNEAESLIEQVKRENNINNIRRLKIGQRISIPEIHRRSDGSIKKLQLLAAVSNNYEEVEKPVGQSFVLESPVSSLTDHQETLAKVRNIWDKLVPVKSGLQTPLALQTSTFSLTLDPQRYPTFSTMDGARVLLDQNGSIPPLVKALIEEKDPRVRIVSEVPADSRQFMSTMLKAAGFYSLEDNFSMDFGADPKLIVNSDFKIEKTPESLLKQDVVLVNSGHNAVPPSLNTFLKKEGFTLYQPFALPKNLVVRDSRPFHIVTAKNQPEMIDAILSSFSVSSDRDRSLDVFAADNNGISLSVKAERYFERNGQRYVITSFDGDPVNYTLFRILETKGYRVVILEAKDDFRKVSEKIISRMKIQGAFAKHHLLQDDSAGYSLQMSGFKLDDKSLPDGGLFLTDLAMDRIFNDLLKENGYRIDKH